MPTTDSSQGVSNCYLFKSRLQEFAQKVGYSTPDYETVKEGPSHEPTFRSTVTVNNVRYESLPGFYNRKAAEQSAAEVALLELSRTRAECISQPVHETGLCKNLLQEYAQKMNYAIPIYHCQKVDASGRVPLFSCTVETGGIKYIGAIARTKKEAEIKAARTALLAIQANTCAPDYSDCHSVLTVVPCKNKVAELRVNSQEKMAVLKPKKKHFKKRLRKKKRAAVDGNHGQNKDNGNVVVPVDDQDGQGGFDDCVTRKTDFEIIPAQVTDSKCGADLNQKTKHPNFCGGGCWTDVTSASILESNGGFDQMPPNHIDGLSSSIEEINRVP